MLFNSRLWHSESSKTNADKFAYFGIFIHPKDIQSAIGEIKRIPNPGPNSYTYMFFPSELREYRSLINETLLRENLLKQITVKDKNKIKSGYRAAIVFNLMNTDFFGFLSCTKILENLPPLFSKYVSTNTGAPVISMKTSNFGDYGYSRFISNEDLVSFDDRVSILDELADLIQSMQNPSVTESFYNFRQFMLGENYKTFF